MLFVEIRVRGRIDESWSEWFEELQIEHSDSDETLLSGWVEDQAVLYGLLARLRDLCLPLLSVSSTEVEVGDQGVPR